MLGFEPLPFVYNTTNTSNNNTGTQPPAPPLLPPGVLEINELLKGYKGIHDIMDMWIILAVEPPLSSSAAAGESMAVTSGEGGAGGGMEDLVFKWRMEAEEGSRLKGKPALTPDQVHYANMDILVNKKH
jgi:hypothetical protein